MSSDVRVSGFQNDVDFGDLSVDWIGESNRYDFRYRWMVEYHIFNLTRLYLKSRLPVEKFLKNSVGLPHLNRLGKPTHVLTEQY